MGRNRRVDSNTITAYTGFIGAIVAFLGLIGGGISYVIRRADRSRETGEAGLVEHLRKQLRYLTRKLEAREADATSWKEQLIESDIKPNPTHWTPIREEDE